nr:NADH dehydrogenase subunit 2 [Ilythea japonica]
MLNNSFKIMFLLTLMMGTLITISSNSWLGAWMGLEMNLLSFIPLMTDNNILSSEASLKYFLTQALASAVLLFGIILLLMESNLTWNIYNNNNNLIMSIILSALLLKSGAAPFHFWFPNLMEGLSWNNSLILMTWQKLAPLMLISYVINNYMINLSIILSSLIGAMGGLNQTSLRKLMAFSSINHLGWMLMAMQINQTTWLIYFFIYTLLSFNMIYFFNLFKTSHINQLFSYYYISKPLKFLLFLNLLSLGGLPPFLGFFPKWLVIQSSTMNNQIMIMVIMMMTTLITLYFYLRLCYSAFMLNYTEINWMVKIQFNEISMNFYMIISFISIFGLMFIPMFFFI